MRVGVGVGAKKGMNDLHRRVLRAGPVEGEHIVRVHLLAGFDIGRNEFLHNVDGGTPPYSEVEGKTALGVSYSGRIGIGLEQHEDDLGRRLLAAGQVDGKVPAGVLTAGRLGVCLQKRPDEIGRGLVLAGMVQGQQLPPDGPVRVLLDDPGLGLLDIGEGALGGLPPLLPLQEGEEPGGILSRRGELVLIVFLGAVTACLVVAVGQHRLLTPAVLGGLLIKLDPEVLQGVAQISGKVGEVHCVG